MATFHMPAPNSLVALDDVPVVIQSVGATQVFCLRILDSAGNPISGVVQRQTNNHYLIEQIKFATISEPTSGYLQICEPLDGVNCSSGLINCHSIPIRFCYEAGGDPPASASAASTQSAAHSKTTMKSTAKSKGKSKPAVKKKPAPKAPKRKPKRRPKR